MKNLLLGLALGLLLLAAGLTLKGENRNLSGTTSSDWNVGGNLSITGTSSLTGTTTITQSVDGIVVGGTISTAATGTVRTLDTNTTGPKVCDASTSHLSVRNNGSFSPSLVFSVGTSTNAAASRNLVASTTIATSTPGTATFTAIDSDPSLFIYPVGTSLTAIMGDITNDLASTTHNSNLTIEYGVWCQDLSI